MNERQELWNRLLQVTLLVLILPATLVHSQTERSDDMSYDWSTFLLLVIPVLIILVVLVLCVTGVFMFCLSTLTMNYDQDCAGHIMGSNNPTPEVKKSLFGLQMSFDKDWVDQSLPVSDAVKCTTGELEESGKSSEDCSVNERTSVDLTEAAESEINDRSLAPEMQGLGKLKEVAIDIESNNEQEKSAHLPAPSNLPPFSPELPHPSSKPNCSTPLSITTLHPSALNHYYSTTLPSLQQLSLHYFRPQDALCSLEVRG